MVCRVNEVYSRDGSFWYWLEQTFQQPYVLTVTKKQPTPINFQTHYAEDLLEKLSEEDWHTLSCGAGTKGERYSDWACFRLSCTQPFGYNRWFLFRRQFSKDKKRFVFSYYQAFAPKDTSLETLAWVAGQRWRIEECFKFAKSHLGLAAARSPILDWLASAYRFSSGSRSFLICFALPT